ncbi:MAG: XRE family transcriptional regulator [Verrucomicrobiota bacterium]
MSVSPDPASLLEALKAVLKDRGLTYPDLAGKLGVSLPTIKRLLNKPGIPLDRLMEICRLADVSLSDLFERATELAPKHSIFTESQDALFAESPDARQFFSELFFERKKPSQIAKEHDLTRLSVEKYLSLLEKVGLLEREPGGRVKFCVSPPIGFGPDSRVLREIQEQFMRSIVDSVIHAKTEVKGRFVIMKPLRLSDQQYEAMLEELRSVIDRFSFLSESGGRTEEAESWQLAVAAGAELEDPCSQSIQNIEN